jgi:uncharacterized membrane protein
MSVRDYRTLFAATSLVLILIAAFPALSMVVPLPKGSERFTELWVLGPNHMAEDYPFNVTVYEQYRVFVGIGNHMGSSARYLVYVKFRNQIQPPPDTSNSEPSPLPPLYEFQVFVADGETWESPVNFSILKVSRLEDSCLVRRVLINGVIFSVDSPSNWDSERNGFYYQLFFELWLYNTTLRGFQFHDRFVGIWLNMTI